MNETPENSPNFDRILLRSGELFQQTRESLNSRDANAPNTLEQKVAEGFEKERKRRGAIAVKLKARWTAFNVFNSQVLQLTWAKLESSDWMTKERKLGVADLLYGAQKWLLFQTTEFKELCQKATITDKDVWSFCQGQVSSLDYYGCEASEIEAALKTRDFGVQRLSDRPDCIKEIAAHIVDSIGKVFKPKQTGGSISSRFHHKKTVAQPIDDAKWLENLIKELRKQDPSFGNPAQPEET